MQETFVTGSGQTIIYFWWFVQWLAFIHKLEIFFSNRNKKCSCNYAALTLKSKILLHRACRALHHLAVGLPT